MRDVKNQNLELIAEVNIWNLKDHKSRDTGLMAILWHELYYYLDCTLNLCINHKNDLIYECSFFLLTVTIYWCTLSSMQDWWKIMVFPSEGRNPLVTIGTIYVILKIITLLVGLFISSRKLNRWLRRRKRKNHRIG